MKKHILFVFVFASLFISTNYAFASRTTNSATLNGVASVTVAPGASITASVNGVVTASDDWHSTGWRVSTTAPGSVTCADTPDHNSGNHTESFTITAPVTPGTYNAYFRISGSNSDCTTQLGTLLTMANAITVSAPDTTPPTLSFTDNVATGPTQSDSIAISFDDAVVKKYGYVATAGICIPTMNTASFTNYTASFSVNTEVNNGKYICAFGQDQAGNKAALASSNPLNIDITKPVIASHANVGPVEGTSASGAIVTYTAPNATDNKDATAPAICTPASGNTFALGATTVTCNKTDTAGNSATATNFTVTVSDTTKPVITLIGSADVTIQAGSTYIDAGSTVTDNVDTGLVAIVTGSVNTGVLGDYTLSFNVTDSHSNVANTVTRIVHVIDTTAPIITLTGGNMSIHTGDTFTDPGSNATDNLDGTVSVSVTGGPVTTATPGTFTLHYNAVDSHGNHATEVTRTVTVVDASIPVITLIGSGSVDVPVFSTYTDQGATATDDVDGDLTSSIIVVNSVNTSVLGNYTVTYNVSDSSSNAAVQITRAVHVVDTVAPVITLNGSNPMNLKKGDVYMEPGATATDNYDVGSIAVDISGVVNTAVPATYVVNYTATDSTGNTTSVSRSVVVRNLGTNSTLASLVPSTGALNPVFDSEITSYTVVLPFGTTTIPTVTATTTDEFATKIITQPSSVNGTAIVAVTSEDTGEDTGTHTTYTVVFSVAENPDHTAPVISLVGSGTVDIVVGNPYVDAGATATDDIDGDITESIVTVSNVNTSILGSYTVTYNVSDSAGNHATQVTRTVNVNNARRGGGRRIIGQVLGASTTGQVLGASTSCGQYITATYMRKGYKKNDPEQVTKLQKFLNDYMKAGIKEDGVFDSKTEKALKKFQLKYSDEILGPWKFKNATGVFYLTTRTKINNLMCDTLNEKVPELVPFTE